jgi:hypothetical protein
MSIVATDITGGSWKVDYPSDRRAPIRITTNGPLFPGATNAMEIARMTKNVWVHYNARAFSAVPEMLGVCRELIHGGGTAESLQRAIDLANLALAKVEAK